MVIIVGPIRGGMAAAQEFMDTMAPTTVASASTGTDDYPMEQCYDDAARYAMNRGLPCYTARVPISAEDEHTILASVSPTMASVYRSMYERMVPTVIAADGVDYKM